MKKVITIIILVMINIIGGQAQNGSEKENYNAAFTELKGMLNDEVPLSFKRAVFISENAYLDNQLSYEEYSKQIESLVKLARAVAASNDLYYRKGDKSEVLLSASLFRIMKDTVIFENVDKTHKSFKVYPYTYDMEDFWGEHNWVKMFVTKLLYTQSGNCHSLPALYKILAEELNVKAYLSLAPNHTYIKQWNDEAGWYNTELTSGQFPYDADIKWNSYIKSEAIADGVYMDTLSAKETIAYVITDLAQGYVRKFGYENVDNPVSWLNTALNYYPDYINALILKAELQKKKYEQLMKEKGVTQFGKLWIDPMAKNKFIELEQSYYHIHQLGYRRMPKEMYLNWLFRARKDTTRKAYRFSTPQPFKKYNYNVTVVTAGDGQNAEFFDDEEIVRIGTVEINRTTGKIVKFVEVDKEDLPDEVISRMYDPALGRWWQIDPMSEVARRWSPYQFCYNNPLRFIDPDGMLVDDYFDQLGNYLGTDGATTTNQRTINPEAYKAIVAGNDGSSTSIQATAELQSNSKIIEAADVASQNATVAGIYNQGEASHLESNTFITLTATYELFDGNKSVLAFEPQQGSATESSATVTTERDPTIPNTAFVPGHMPGDESVKAVVGVIHPHPTPTDPNATLVRGVSTTDNAQGGNDLKTAASINAPVFAVDRKFIHSVNASGVVNNKQSRNTEILRNALNQKAGLK